MCNIPNKLTNDTFLVIWIWRSCFILYYHIEYIPIFCLQWRGSGDKSENTNRALEFYWLKWSLIMLIYSLLTCSIRVIDEKRGASSELSMKYKWIEITVWHHLWVENSTSSSFHIATKSKKDSIPLLMLHTLKHMGLSINEFSYTRNNIYSKNSLFRIHFPSESLFNIIFSKKKINKYATILAW